MYGLFKDIVSTFDITTSNKRTQIFRPRFSDVLMDERLKPKHLYILGLYNSMFASVALVKSVEWFYMLLYTIALRTLLLPTHPCTCCSSRKER